MIRCWLMDSLVIFEIPSGFFYIENFYFFLSSLDAFYFFVLSDGPG